MTIPSKTWIRCRRALDDLEVHAHGVARLELGQVRAQIALLEALDRRVHEKKRPAVTRLDRVGNASGTRSAEAASRS